MIAANFPEGICVRSSSPREGDKGKPRAHLRGVRDGKIASMIQYVDGHMVMLALASN
jgi:hypothetical protein